MYAFLASHLEALFFENRLFEKTFFVLRLIPRSSERNDWWPLMTIHAIWSMSCLSYELLHGVLFVAEET